MNFNPFARRKKKSSQAKMPAASSDGYAADAAYGNEGRVTAATDVDTSIVSLDRGFMGFFSEGFRRLNPDDLAGKKGLAIYARMRIDEQVKAAVTFKRDAIISRGWTFEFDEDSKLSDTEKAKRKRVVEQIVRRMPGTFVDSLNQIATGREFGFSLTEKVYQPVEIDGAQYVGVKALLGRDPCTFNFYTDKYGSLVRCEQEAAAERIPIDLAKFVHYVHNPEFDHYFGRSDLREAYRSWYFKNEMIKFWGLYMEKMGGGLVVASITAESNIQPNSVQYRELTTALAQVKASASVLLPKGVTAQVVFPQSSDAFEKACTWHDLAIAKALLVPNLAGVSHTGQTGAYSQAQSQMESFAWTLAADAARMESCIDEQLFSDLAEQNWGDGEYPCFKFKPLSGEMLRWIIDTWCKLVTAGTVIPTDLDEARLREILEMPPRDDKTPPLVDPNEEAQRQHELAVAEATGTAPAVGPGQGGKAPTGGAPAQGKGAAPTPKAGAPGKDKAGAPPTAVAKRDAKRLLDWLDKSDGVRSHNAITMGFDPNQPRDPDGKWGDGVGEPPAGSLDVTHAPAISAAAAKKLTIQETTAHLASRGLKLEGLQPRASDGYKGRYKITDRNGNSKEVSADHIKDLLTGKTGVTRHGAITPRDARLAIASARERVDFAVIDRKQMMMHTALTAELSTLVARAVAKELGSDDDLAKLTDADTQDIGQWQLPAIIVGRLKVTWQRALQEAWSLGKDQARAEVRKTKKVINIRFADLRDKAAAHMEANGFRMAGNVSDGVRAVIQAELLNSVKNGRSPPQTRTAIWDRLTAKGFSSREAVRSAETDEGVLRALDALWVDDESQAAHYLDTLARTNLFEAMNEARYAEFTDPALQDFVRAFRYSAILDDRTTDICSALHDHVYESGNPLWDEYRPPNHYNCRSILVPITALDMEDGVWDGEESEEPTVEPQEGFGA